MNEVRLKLENREPMEKCNINTPVDAIEFIQEMLGGLACEYLVALHLNSANEPMNFHIVSGGGISEAYVDPKALFTTALLQASSKIILVHNHPSGDVEPSEADINITDRLIADAAMMNLEILDHIIVSDKKIFSFSDNGIMNMKDSVYQDELKMYLYMHGQTNQKRTFKHFWQH